LKENVIMGRLIPAGTGMKHYRNVEISPDATENRKEADEFDEIETIRGGLDIPILGGVPGIDDGDLAEDFDGDGEENFDLEGTEEFDIDEAMKIDLDDDEL
jgi:DNA-directed RNA polymerase subunit beta'